MFKNVESTEMFSIDLCRKNPRKLYIFGDNIQKIGMGGQAIIRKELNSFGISSKYSIMESYDDKRFLENKRFIDQDVVELKILMDAYDKVVFSQYGIGTGLASLQSLAPRTFLYLSQVLLDNFGFNNVKYLIPIKR